MSWSTAPALGAMLTQAAGRRPLAIVLAGHNGSGKSTIWYDQLADTLQIPLVNADRLTLSLLPPTGQDQKLKPWAATLRDADGRWQRLSQDGVQLFMGLIMDQGMPFAFETVFSYYQPQADGSIKSKADTIRTLQHRGYFVVLLFVALASADISILRVSTRRAQGGHDVPESKLRTRFPRTQQAVRLASSIADLTVMFDNSRGLREAFTIARVQRRRNVVYDCRTAEADPEFVRTARVWLDVLAPLNGKSQG